MVRAGHAPAPPRTAAMMTWKLLLALLPVLPLILGQEAGQEYNLTTITPDDETIDSLLSAVDSAVDSLQSAIGASSSEGEAGSPNYYDLENYGEPGGESEDYFTGEEGEFYQEYTDYSSGDGDDVTDDVDEEDETDEDYGDEDEEVVIEESQLTESTYNRTVSWSLSVSSVAIS